MGLFDIFKKKQEPSPGTNHIDFSTIDSNEKAQSLFAKGQLVKLYLMPLDFGGEDSPINTLFVPAPAQARKESFDARLAGMLEGGLNLGYAAKPEYKGKSFIPAKLIIQVTGDKQITETIDIW